MAVDPFALLGIPRSFDLDVAQIEGRWRELSRAVHPDKHQAGGASDRRQALSKAMDLNEAFRTVKDPLKRAEAIVRLSETIPAGAKEPPPDMELLMSVMQLRGDLGNARAAGDIAAIRSAIAQVADLNAAATREASAALSALVAAPDAGAGALALQKIGKLRYYRRFLEEAQAIVDDVVDTAAAAPAAPKGSP